MKTFLAILLLGSGNALHLSGDDMTNVEVETDGVVTDADGSVSLSTVAPAPKPKKKKKSEDDDDPGDIRENMDSDVGAMSMMTAQNEAIAN